MIPGIIAAALASASPLVFTNEALSPATESAGTYSDSAVLAFGAGDLEVSTDYLVFWSADIGMSATGISANCRFTVDGVETVYTEIRSSTLTDPYETTGGVYVYSTGGSPPAVTFAIQFRRETTGTCKIRNARISVIKLGANDEHVTSITRATTTATSYSTAATLSFTPPSAGDYLYIASFVYDSTATANRLRNRFNDGATSAVMEYTVSSTAEAPGATRIWRRNGISGAQTVNFEFSATTAGQTSGIAEIRLIALRLADFANVYSTILGATNSGSDASYTATATQTFTPAAGSHLVLGSWGWGAPTSGLGAGTRLNDGGTAINETFSYGASGLTPFPGIAHRLEHYSASSRTQSLDRFVTSGGSAGIVNGSGIITLDLAGR